MQSPLEQHLDQDLWNGNPESDEAYAKAMEGIEMKIAKGAIKGTQFQTGSGSQDDDDTMRIYVDGVAHQISRRAAMQLAVNIIGHLERSGGVPGYRD